jgi:hypothetical protein
MMATNAHPTHARRSIHANVTCAGDRAPGAMTRKSPLADRQFARRHLGRGYHRRGMAQRPPKRGASKTKLVVPLGAAYSVPVDGKVFGVCRVIAEHPSTVENNRRAVLVALTRWTGTRAELRSALTDARSGEILQVTTHNRNEPYVACGDG